MRFLEWLGRQVATQLRAPAYMVLLFGSDTICRLAMVWLGVVIPYVMSILVLSSRQGAHRRLAVTSASV